MKLGFQAYCIIAICVFLGGCETVGAFGTGRMTASDVMYIAHSGALGKTSTPVNINSIDADDEYVPPAGSGSRRIRPKPGISKTDAWLEDNLW